MMRNLLLSFKKIGLGLVLLLVMVVKVFGATYTSVATGNWNADATWSGTGTPGAGDIVNIATGHTITVTTNAACTSITFTGTSGALAVNSGITLTVSGAVTLNSITTSNTACTLSGAGTLNCNSITVGTGGGSSTTTNRSTTLTSTLTSLNVTNRITLNSSYATRRNNSTFTHTSGTVTVAGITTITPSSTTSTYSMGNSSPMLNLTGSVPFTIGTGGTNTITLTGTGATVDYQSSSAVTLLSIPAGLLSYRNLIISGGGTKTLGANTAVSGALTVRAGTTLNKSTFTLATPTSITLETVGGGDGASITGSTALTLGGNITVNYTNSGAITTGASISSPITLGATRMITVADDVNSSIPEFEISGIIGTGTAGLTKAGSGTLTLSGANTYTGTTTINSGILQLGAAERIANTSNVVLGGGTFSTGAATGFTETVGQLNLSANSTIVLGTGNHTLTFSNSNGVVWNGTSLTIDGWTGTPGSSGTSGKIFFGTTTGTLTAAQLGKINFTGYSGTPTLLSTGELVPSGAASSSPTDFFRTKTTGSWGSVSTWESSFDGNSWIDATLTPTDESSSIVVRTGHSVSVNVDVSIDQTQVENGATLSVNTGQTLTLNNGSGADLTVDGSLIVNGTWINSGTTAGSGAFTFNNGGNYEHAQDGGTIPIAAWNAGSTCKITGITSQTSFTGGIGQTFSNFIWDCNSQSSAFVLTTGSSGNFEVNETLTINRTNAGSLRIPSPDQATVNVGTYTQTGGTVHLIISNSGSTRTLNVSGNFTLNNTTTNATFSAFTDVNFNGILNVGGNFTITNSTFNASASSGLINVNFNGGTQQFLNTSGTFSGPSNFSILSGSTVDFGTSVLNGSNGTFTLNSGAGIITANTGGLTTSGSNGSIQVTGTRTFNTGANYTFNGSSAQVTGNALGGAANLTFDNASGVTLSSPVTVSGLLNLNSGIVTTSTANLISVTNTSPSAISGASATSFVNGPIRWTLPASLASGSTYSFPLGEGTAYMPFTLENPTTGTGTTTAQIEAFAANSGGSIDATLDSKSSTEYWSLTTSGNFTNSSVSVDRGSAISPYDIIAGATSQSGTYTSLEGTAGATGVSNSDLIGSNRFFVLAEKKKNTITTGTISGSPFCQGATVSVPFTISGTYNSGNIFTAQLSDASGSFSSPVAIGSLTSTGAGTISATIPSGASGGTGYRIRVVSSNPSVTGSDNGSNIAINVIPSAPLVGTIVQPTCDVATGSVTLNGLPSENWTVTMNPGGVKTTGSGSSATITNLAPGTYSFTVTGEDESTACPGSGNGLKGEYFNVMDLSGTPVLTRTDATVNFNWGTGTPGSPVNVNVFSVRWSGKVQACYTENYTFTTRSDDGIRLSVNGTQIINNWTDHSATNNSGNIPLVAGQKYDIVLEFYENGGDAVSQLSWSSPSQPTSVVIPQSQLYSEATGCSSVASANVVINSQPAVPAAPTSVTPSSATSVCLGESVNLNATSAGNTIYWFTQASGGTTIGSSNSGENFSVSPSVNTTYYAETRSSSGCISATRTATGLITVTSGLSAVVLSPSSQQNICIDGSGSQITVAETNGGTISSRQWGKRSVSGGAITNIAGATGSTYTPTGTELGSGTWYLVCTSTPTCGSAMTSNEITIVVSESIGGTVSGGVTPACLGSSIGTLTLTGYTGTIKNWEKRVDGGSWSYITNTSATYSETPSSAGTWQYRAVVQNGSCNVANSSEISIVVDPVSVGGGVYDGTSPICLNSSTGTMNLRAGYVGNVVRWEKRVDGGTWSNIANTSTTYSENPSVPGIWEYRALVQSGSCTAVYSTAFSVVVNPELTISLGANPSVCQTTTATTIPYSATTGNPADWVLTFNAAAISAGFSNPQNGSLASTPGNIPVNIPYNVAAGVYQANLKLIKYTPSCSSADYPVTITVSAGQSASVTIAANSNPICSGTSVTYTATPTNGGSTPTYQWKVNGTNAGTNSPTYSYTPANGDVVTCVLTSSETCASGSPVTSNSVTMTVNVLPTASISGTTTVCPNAASPAITFTGSGSTAPYTFTYKINGGSDLQVTTTSGNSVTVNAPTETSGNFIYSLVSVSDALGCSQAQTGQSTVTVRPQMTVSTDAPAQLCQHTIKMVTATVSGGSGNYTYAWQVVTPGASTLFIPGSTTSDFIWLTGFSLSPANYEYRLTVTDTSWGCVKTFDFTVTILPNQNTNWISNPSSACVGQTGAIYSVQNTAGTTYAWTVTGGTIAEGQGTSQIKVNWGSSAGNFNVSLTTTTGTCTQEFLQAVAISSLPTINLGNNPAVCSGTVTASLNYSTTTGSPNRYSIDYDATANSAGFVDVVNASLLSSAITLSIPAAATPAVYNGTLSVNNSGIGCESISYPITVTINTNLPVSISIDANNNPVCAGSGVTFTATPVNGGDTPEFQWKVNGNDVGTNSATYSYIPVNGDVVTCRLTSDVNCATGNPATSNTITMTVNPIPAVTNSPTKTICNGSSTNISLTATTASNFSWTIGTITGGITGASAGSGSSIDHVLTNPSNSSAGSVQYIVTPTSLSGTCVGSPFTITVTVQSINALVSDISDEIGSDCPDFGDFNPNTASYNPGYTEVKFRVERDLSSSAWNFDYNLTGGVVYSGSPEVASATKSIAVGTGSVDMVFYVANTPGAAQNIVFKVVNVSDSNCSNNGINRTVTHTISAMPAIGSFN